MTKEFMEKLLNSGEGYTIEYKENTNELSKSVFETVCAFSNRYGGHILLGVKEIERDGHKVGEVVGVDKDKIYDMKRNFIDVVNNTNKFNPTLYLELEEFNYDEKTILWTYVPATSQLCFCNKKVYDRNGDADQNVTSKTIRMGEIISRKSADYYESRVLPYVEESDLKMELMDKVRKFAQANNSVHPWKTMSDMDIMRSAGLYVENKNTGERGFTLAAVLLLGKPEVIKSCMPYYRVDAIYRVENVDRYDDRLIIEDNLIEAYDKLIEFCIKHMDDRFVLDKDLRVDARSWIVREVVANLLIHRDYSNAYPARLVIEKSMLWTENWSKSRFNGKLDFNTYVPYPKNPLIANFFVNIGRADTLGSGFRNLNKYTKLYSNSEPELVEGDVFKTKIPLIKTTYSDYLSEGNMRYERLSQFSEGLYDNKYLGCVKDKFNIDLKQFDVSEYSHNYMTRKIFESIYKKYSYNKTVVSNMDKVFKEIDEGQVFGSSDIVAILGCARSTAAELLRRFREMGVVVEVKGQGKGKYRFVDVGELN